MKCLNVPLCTATLPESLIRPICYLRFFLKTSVSGTPTKP